MRRSFPAFLVACVWVGGTLGALPAAADDGRLRLMRETIAFTDVSDAVDGDDPFDMAAHIDFTRAAARGTVRRERGGTTRPIADSEMSRSELMFGVDIGLFRDLMLSLRLPLTLADRRTLSAVSDRAAADVQADLDDIVGGDPGTAPLFQLADAQGMPVNFKSPTRAGLDYLGIGGAWGVLNQTRRPEMPTLVLVVEGRFAVGKLMRPCQRTPDGKTRCGNEGIGDFGSDAGSSHGLNGFRFEVRTSHRYRYAEPYAGFGTLIQWPSRKGEEAFWPVGDVDGYIHRLPSQRVQTQLGTVFLPWESRARFQRVGFDVGVHGTFFSPGHDYTPLFDALGTSTHAQLVEPLPEGDIRPGSGDPSLRSGGFTGLADVQSHFLYGLKVGLEVQAARYVRFQLGSSLSWITRYTITASDPCNPRVARQGASDPRAGACESGVINPHHRGVIDLPGRRFVMGKQFLYDLYFGATASF